MIRVHNLSFQYQSDSPNLAVLKRLSFEIKTGEFVAIQGRSGSGKSTLFYLLGGLLSPSEGSIHVHGKELTSLSSDELSFLRNETIGFVFQQFHLLPRATVLENILLPALYPCEWKKPQKKHLERARELARRVGLADKLMSLPNQLSGGEQQRVAIARALLADAPLILADEPTGNLDSRNAESFMELLRELGRQGKTVVIITHDNEIAKKCDRTLVLQDGQLVGQSAGRTPADPPPVKPALSAPSYLRVARAVLPLTFQNLKRNRIRSFLTMVGVTIGIASVFSMITFGGFAKEQILKGFEELGVNTVLIQGWRNHRMKAKDKVDVLFTSFDIDRDINRLKDIFPQIRLSSPLLQMWRASINYGGYSVEKETQVWGVSAEYHGMVTRFVTAGRPITPHDVAARNPVCLIGSEIPERLFQKKNPLGEMLFVLGSDGNPFPCRIIGTLSPETSAQDWRKPNLEVYLPYTYFQSVGSRWDGRIRTFMVQVESGADQERVGKSITTFFKQRYGKSGDINVNRNSLLAAQVRKFLGLFAVLLIAIAAITLGVGAMGINNMMLVSVAERVKEIGLRKAIGATPRSIRVQFLMESTVLSLVAGLAGVLLGFTVYESIIYIASMFVTKIKFAWILEPTALLFSSLSIIVVGIASGIVPALRAEKLSVIEALRSE